MKRFIPSIVVSCGIPTAALRLIGILALTAVTSGLTNAAKAAEPGTPSADSADARREQFMKDIVSRPFKNNTTMLGTVPFALSAYWLNQRLPEADAAVIRAASPELPGVGTAKDQGETHWHYNRQSFLLQRVYFLFNSRSEYFPGRMSKAAEDAVAATMWESASTACKKEMTRPESMWWSGGSENIIARCMASFWGAAQIFANHPDYRDRKYADGTPVQEMARAFNDYYKEFTRQRASRGVMVEVGSPTYTPWTLASWYNIADFAPDPVTRKRMRMFLDLFWADYAIEQMDGVRGGSRHRCYPGGYASVCGGGGSEVAWFFFGVGKPAVMNPKNISAMTTLYRPSPVVDALVRAGAARGTYAYVSRRLGKGATAEQVGKPKETVRDSKTANGEDSDETPADGKPAKPAQGSEKSEDAEAISAQADCTDPNGGNLLRYTFCTPDFVMGTSMVPALPLSAWTPISSQNRWEGVIFAGHPTTGIFPQAEGGHACNASWSVQSKGVMIAQRLRTSKGAKGQRVWFDAPLKRESRDGWVFAEAAQAYAAVRVVEGGSRWESDEVKKNKPVQGIWLRCENEYSPVMIDVARKSDYPDFAAFQKAILANALTWKRNRLDYRSELYKTRLTLFADYSKPPEVNGVPINYSPAKCYDSPFIQGDWGSGVVTIQKGDRKVVLDFNESTEPPPHPSVGRRFVPADVDWPHPVYATTFDHDDALADWKLEGGKRMSIAHGRLVLESDSGGPPPAASNNHLVCWLTREMPANFLLEFKVRPQDRKQGLNIVFFNARGLHGESIFDPAIKPRSGIFAEYHSGDLNNYHISYWAGKRGTANVRKNAGFHLVATGKDLVVPGPAEAFQTVRLYKRGGVIRLMVDDVIAVAFDDDGKTYGPAWTHSGWIGLRQMAHTVRCEYDDLKIFPLKP